MPMDLSYPIGKFEWNGEATQAQRRARIEDIERAPAEMRKALAGLNDEQLDTPYRPGGWTVRQLAHHVPDSHLNAYMRFKLALTEDQPTIKPYEQERWAELEDTRTTPVEVSLTLLDSLHQRWVQLLLSLAPADFARTFRHPELGLVSLDKNLALYAWHGRHHVAHVTALRERLGWR